MLKELKIIKQRVWESVAITVATHIQGIEVGTIDLGVMDYIKEDHGAIRPTVKVFTVSAMYVSRAGEFGDYADAEYVAHRLLAQIEDAASHVSGRRIVHLSNPYFDYKPGQLFQENANHDIRIDVAIYSYDGTTFRSVVQTRYGAHVGYTPENSTHMPLIMTPHKIRVYPQNVLRDVQGRNTTAYFEDVIHSFDDAVNEERARLVKMREACLTHDKVQTEMQAGANFAAALLTQEFFQKSVSYIERENAFLMDRVYYPGPSLLQMILIQGGLYGAPPIEMVMPVEVVDDEEEDIVVPEHTRAGMAYRTAQKHLNEGEALKFIQTISDYFARPITMSGTGEVIEFYTFMGKKMQASDLLQLIVEHWRAQQTGDVPEIMNPERKMPSVNVIAENAGLKLALQVLESMDGIEACISDNDLVGAGTLVEIQVGLPVLCSPDLMTGEAVFTVNGKYVWTLSYLRTLREAHPDV